MRLQKFIAGNSSYSRRTAEDLIADCRVKVNGKTQNTPGIIIDPAKDRIEVNGVLIKDCSEKIYIALNKPAGYTSTKNDIHAEKTVMDLIPFDDVHPVGRLDKDTTGLLLLSNDGDFTYKITHPKFEHEKEYIVHLIQELHEEDRKILENGIRIDGKQTSKCKITKTAEEENQGKNTFICNVIIHEGRKRQIRRMFEEIGNKVIYLKRIRIGKIYLGNLE
ncbi:rRNA pseudouridine synthase, partial [Patescibacteria group bacterium]|nr:rRNA pseudouridine synthase [Patescibacteria group bacterium]